MEEGSRGRPVQFLPNAADAPCSACSVPSKIQVFYTDELVRVDMCYDCAGVDEDFPTLDVSGMCLSDQEDDTSATETTRLPDGTENGSRNGSQSRSKRSHDGSRSVLDSGSESGSKAGVPAVFPLGVEHRWDPSATPHHELTSPRLSPSQVSPKRHSLGLSLTSQVSPSHSHSPYHKSPRPHASRTPSPGLAASGASQSPLSRSTTRISGRSSPGDSLPGQIFHFSPVSSPRSSPAKSPLRKSPVMHRLSSISPQRYSPPGHKTPFSLGTPPRNVPNVPLEEYSEYYIPPLAPLDSLPELPVIRPMSPIPNLACLETLPYLSKGDSSRRTSPLLSRDSVGRECLSPKSPRKMSPMTYSSRHNTSPLCPVPFQALLPGDGPPPYQALLPSPPRHFAQSNGRSLPGFPSRTPVWQPNSETDTLEKSRSAKSLENKDPALRKNVNPARNLGIRRLRPSSGDQPQTRQGTGQRAYDCQFCHATFSRWTHLKEHLTMHSMGNWEHSLADDSEEHTNLAKPEPQLRPHSEGNYKCSRCDRTFRSTSHLKVHLHTHSWDK